MTTKTKELIKSGIHTAALVTQTPILDEGDVESKRQEILDYFHDTFTLYESLFECLADDDAFYAIKGLVGMKLTQDKPTTSTAKNIGRSNETTNSEQAVLEAMAKWEKKLKEGYAKSPREVAFSI